MPIPNEWDPDWFKGFIQDALANLDTRNALGVGILVTGESASVATYAVDSQNVDIAEGLDTRALIGVLMERIEELEISKETDTMAIANLNEQIEELRVEFG